MAKKNSLDTARAELTAAQAKLDTIDAEEAAATETPEAFAAWRANRDAAAVEVGRLTGLVRSLEQQAEQLLKDDAEDTRRKRVAAANKRNAELSRQIVDFGAGITEQSKTLMRDVAIAQIEDDELNALRNFSDDEFIVGAEFLARGRPAVPRKDLKQEELMLWVFKSTGNLIGNQDEVVETGPGVGFLPAGSNNMSMANQPCVQRKYVSRTYLPAEPAQHPPPLAMQLRMPDFRGPGLSWDGSRAASPTAILQELDREPPRAQPRRSAMTELEPIGPMPEDPQSEMQKTFARNRERA